MYIGTVQPVPKEPHQFTEGTGTDNSALLRIALTGPPNYLLKEGFIFLLYSKAKSLRGGLSPVPGAGCSAIFECLQALCATVR